MTETRSIADQLESLDGDTLFYYPDDGILIAWNGSATFNMYRVRGNALVIVDCATRYYCEAGYGPGDTDATYRAGKHWARLNADDLRDMLMKDDEE